jgi:cytidyltransferase-like protein
MHMAKKIAAIGLGGTFDHFHAGHEKFIRFAAELADLLIIGVTNEKMTRGKALAHLIEPYPVRLQAVKAFCHRQNIRAKVNMLEDELGPTLEGAPMHALCVTQETTAGADKINILRERLGLYKFPVYICDFELDDHGEPIHSSRIRQGLINRTGTVYVAAFNRDVTLSENAREYFSQPLGEVLTGNELTKPGIVPMTDVVAVVGDSSLEQFLEHRLPYQLGVYDQKQQRQAYSSSVMQHISPNFTASNPAGQITTDLSHNLMKCLPSSPTQKPAHILVQGEEDLAAVALILLLPLESIVFYGQPNQGLVRMKISEELKQDTWELLTV